MPRTLLYLPVSFVYFGHVNIWEIFIAISRYLCNKYNVLSDVHILYMILEVNVVQFLGNKLLPINMGA